MSKTDGNFDTNEQKDGGFETETVQDETAVTDSENASFFKEETATENMNEAYPDMKNAEPFAYAYKPIIPNGYTEKTYGERLSIRKGANTVALPLIMLYAISLVFSIIGLVRSAFIFYGNGDPLPVFSDVFFLQFLQIIASTLMFVLPFSLIIRKDKLKIRDLVPFEKPKKGTLFPCFLIGVSMCGLANVTTVFMGNFFYSIGIDYSMPTPNDPTGFLGVSIVLLSTAVVPPLVEEFAMRGIVMGRLIEYGEGFAVVISAILFGVMHGNFEQMPFAFVVGLALGFARVKTGSIWTCILIHCFNNLTATVFSYSIDRLPTAQANALYSLFYAVLLLLGALGVFLFSTKDNKFSLESGTLELSANKKYSAFFTTPAVIVACALFVLEAFSYFFI